MSCRFCTPEGLNGVASFNPFELTNWFGGTHAQPAAAQESSPRASRRNAQERRSRRERQRRAPEEPGPGAAGVSANAGEANGPDASAASRRDQVAHALIAPPPRDPKDAYEVAEIVGRWLNWTHPRADNFFKVQDVLLRIVTNLNRGQDPVTGQDPNCIFWYGGTYKDENCVDEAVMTIERQGGDYQSVFVNRMLVYIFATDESFDIMMKYPKLPFRMACGNQLCVNLGHVDTTTPPPVGDPAYE